MFDSSMFAFFNAFKDIYLFLIPVCLLLTFFKGKATPEGWNGLYVLNTISFLLQIVLFFDYAFLIFMAWYGQNSYDGFAFFSAEPINKKLLWFLVSLNLLPLVFYWRKLRISRYLTIFLYLFLPINLIGHLINYFDRDYRPSSWIISYDIAWFEYLYIYGIALLVIGLIYFIAYKRKKLPYASVFLK